MKEKKFESSQHNIYKMNGMVAVFNTRHAKLLRRFFCVWSFLILNGKLNHLYLKSEMFLLHSLQSLMVEWLNSLSRERKHMNEIKHLEFLWVFV